MKPAVSFRSRHAKRQDAKPQHQASQHQVSQHQVFQHQVSQHQALGQSGHDHISSEIQATRRQAAFARLFRYALESGPAMPEHALVAVRNSKQINYVTNFALRP
jgi:hypothetical protein